MRKSAILCPALLLVLAGCAGDGVSPPPLPSLADLVGSWKVSAYFYSPSDSVSQEPGKAAAEDLSRWLLIAESGEFRACGIFRGDHGTISVRADSLFWGGENRSGWAHLSLEAGQLVLRWFDEELVDLDADGQRERANLLIAFRRESEWESQPATLYLGQPTPVLTVPDTVLVGQEFEAVVVTFLGNSCVRRGTDTIRRLTALRFEISPFDSVYVGACQGLLANGHSRVSQSPVEV